MVKKEEEGKGKDGKSLLGRLKFKKLENGRFKCVETGHEVPSHAKDSYAQSKHCWIGLIDAALARNKPPIDTFHQGPLVRRFEVLDEEPGDDKECGGQRMYKLPWSHIIPFLKRNDPSGAQDFPTGKQV